VGTQDQVDGWNGEDGLLKDVYSVKYNLKLFNDTDKRVRFINSAVYTDPISKQIIDDGSLSTECSAGICDAAIFIDAQN
jgi:hypothetical protein